MKKKRILRRNVCIILLLLLTAQYSFSQNNFKVTGKVTDEAGRPVPGATVQIKGTALATATIADGSYSLTAPSSTSRLVITSVGFAEQEIAIDNKSIVNISIVNSTSALEDVVVIGYATVKKKDVTGSVAGINQKDIRSRPVDNALQAMQGKVAGVDITSNERPGQVGSINIRGVRSLTASNTPLFVVDGIPLTTGGH